MTLRYFLPIYLVVYFTVAFFWRSYLVWKRTGTNPVVFKGSDDAHDFIGRIFKLLLAMVVVVAVLYSFLPQLYQYLMPVAWLEQRWIKGTGVVLLIASLAWTVLAQAQMGNSWRIGIDHQRETQLVQNGLFSISRNPIFLGIMVTLGGLFLAIPNAISLLMFVLGVVLINIQVRLEEQFLKAKHGENYDQYTRRVRRWI